MFFSWFCAIGAIGARGAFIIEEIFGGDNDGYCGWLLRM